VKKKRIAVEQIVAILKQTELGISTRFWEKNGPNSWPRHSYSCSWFLRVASAVTLSPRQATSFGSTVIGSPCLSLLCDDRLHRPFYTLLETDRDQAPRQSLTRQRPFAWLYNFRRLVSRWEHQEANFLGVLQLGCFVILARHL